MHCKQWIFDMDGTLTDSMVVVWEGAPEALLARFGRTPKADLHDTLLTMGMEGVCAAAGYGQLPGRDV